MMGTGEASGEKRAIEAAEAAISNPLLDDVSMRGARGLLISITGGPDLTLYEVDEAATRIREEVDPEANIILGATFDESLEGIMRVSVVATGLAAEALKGAKPQPAEEPAEKPSVFGFVGKHPAPPKKVNQPAPMAARPTAAPFTSSVASSVAASMASAPQAPAPRTYADEAEHHEMEPEQAPLPLMPERAPQPAMRQMRMPAIEEFPPRQIEAQQTRIESIAEHAQKKKPGLFQRLANVGLGRKDDLPAQPAPREPSMAAQQPQRPLLQNRPQPQPQPPQSAEPHLDDDQLEIPAFLRRQAN
jgi:cell division protein FtsZ